jgi:hypothetical protein
MFLYFTTDLSTKYVTIKHKFIKRIRKTIGFLCYTPLCLATLALTSGSQDTHHTVGNLSLESAV